MSRILNVVVLCVYFILPIEASADFIVPVEKNEFKVMSYNVQNLFDSAHDTGKRDYEFLPKKSPEKKNCKNEGRFKAACENLDWTSKKVGLKISQIKKVLAGQGSLPDVLVLVEVENNAVVSQLAKALGYDGFVMTDSPDPRGIDCAVLYSEKKLKPLKYIEHSVDNALYPTRNLSLMLFQLDPALGGGVFGVFPNHWPSQGNPTKARTIVANELRNFVDYARQKYGSSFNYVITGDFNTIDSDTPNPIESVLLDPKWTASLRDVAQLAKDMKNPMLPYMPPGTYYYGVDNTWSELDRFFVNSDLNDNSGLEVDPQSFRIHAPDFLTRQNQKKEKVPFRYNHESSTAKQAGYSDHFAVVVKFSYK